MFRIYLYNYYRETNKNIPNKYEIDKNLILEKEIIDKLNELTNNKNKSKIIKQKNDKTFDNKYYYFNKSKNDYFKKLRCCSFDNCYKIANFKDNSTNKEYCKTHSNNDVVNINNKINFIRCKYDNCKKIQKVIIVKTINLNVKK